VRFLDFLKTAVLLFAGAANALAVVTIIGAGTEDRVLLYGAFGWWLVAAGVGGYLGRRRQAFEGVARLMSTARATPALPELEPGTVLFNRLWPLAVVAVTAGALGIFFPPVPAVGTGYALLVALLWRKQSAAVEAIEGRDGVEFWLDRSSPFGPPQLLRLPGMRKIEPEPETVRTP